MVDLNHRTLSQKYESLDYDLVENVIYLEHQHKSKLNNFITRDLQRWLAIFIIGLATAISGFFASFIVNYLTRLKFTEIISISQEECHNNSTEPYSILQLLNCMSTPYLTWLIWNLGPSLFGSIIVTYIAPVAAGSGIPVVKCYLNGVQIPEVVQFKTYVVKLVGVVSSVVGGLIAGKEGPFIHCGAAIGAGLSQGKIFNWDTKLFKTFRNDRDKRDFVSAGASAGVAAAFGAPIGGVLFALEEGASFWNQALTLRIFFCSMMTSFILNLFMSAYNQHAGVLSFYSLVNFGLVEELDYFWFEIPVYICIAIMGGILGAIFCRANYILTILRKKYITKNYLKVLETLLVAIITTTVGILLILLVPDCQKIPKQQDSTLSSFRANSPAINGLSELFDFIPVSGLSYNIFSKSANESRTHPLTYNTDDEVKKALKGHVFNFMCQPGEYSAMSSLWLKTSEGVSSTFMVLQEDIWSMKTLALFLVAYYFLAIFTYGLSISSGIFIPSILIGATGGRLIGLALRYYFGPLEWLLQLNKFSIIGAVSVLGGVVRMTISLTVIIIEATGCISFGMPIMICLIVSKWVADSFIIGLYDIAIHLANVPFLEWDPPYRSYSIYASDVMSPDVKVLQTTETVGNLVSILKSTTHNGFPVVDFDDDESYCPQPTSSNYYTPQKSPSLIRQHHDQSTSSDTHNIIHEDSLIGSFQRCSITAKRESYGRFRGLVLRWQILVMLDQKIFNENEKSFEMFNLSNFQCKYPDYPSIEQVISGLSIEMYQYHVDFRSIMNPTPYAVHHSSSFPRIFQLFRSLGLRHLTVIDDRNQVVGMITRKDLARYVRERDKDGMFKFQELKYTS